MGKKIAWTVGVLAGLVLLAHIRLGYYRDGEPIRASSLFITLAVVAAVAYEMGRDKGRRP